MPSGGARPGAGRPRKPVEQKRLLGNPGKRKLPPKSAALVPLESMAPDPAFPLGQAGRDLWRRAWATGVRWLASTDTTLLQVTCESLDERMGLRVKVLREGNPDDRRGLRDLDRSISAGLRDLGFTPTARAGLAGSEIQQATAASALAEMIAHRGQALADEMTADFIDAAADDDPDGA